MPKSKQKEKRSNENKKIYYGNRFNAIPLTSSNGIIELRDIYIVEVQEPLLKAIRFIIDKYRDVGFGNLKSKQNRLKPHKFTNSLKVLNYNIIAVQNDFYLNNGEWLYLTELIDLEQLKFSFKRWCNSCLDNNDYELLYQYIDTGITIINKTIKFALNPHVLKGVDCFYLYKLLPNYISMILSGNVKVSIPSTQGMGITTHDFYRMQSKNLSSELISLPFKYQSLKSQYNKQWTYSMDIYIKTIKGVSHPFLFLNLRITRLLNEIPELNGKSANTIVYRKTNDGKEKYQVFKLPLYSKKESGKQKIQWTFDLIEGLRSKSLQELNDMPEIMLKSYKENQSDVDRGIGLIFGSHLASVASHDVTPRSSEFDEQPIYEKVLEVLRNQDKSTNINFGNFLELENIEGSFDKAPNKESDFRFEQLPDELIIELFYTTSAWIQYLIESIEILFSPKALFNSAQCFGKATVLYNSHNSEFSILYKGLEKKIKFVKVHIDEQQREEKFFFPYKYESIETFKEYLTNLVKNSGISNGEIRPALFELEYEEEVEYKSSNNKKPKIKKRKVFGTSYIDPKSIIRNTMAKHNRITQFVTYQYSSYQIGNKKVLIKFKNAVMDMFRQLGIIGKMPFKDNQSGQPILVGLWYILKNKSSFTYGIEDHIMPRRLCYPVLVALIDNKIKMAFFTKTMFNQHRCSGKEFKVCWVSYSEGLIAIAQNVGIFDELNEEYADKIKRQFINNALSSLSSYNVDMKREIVLFVNSQNSRQHINELYNYMPFETKLSLDIDGIVEPFWENIAIVRIVTDDQNETPGWIHIDFNKNPIYGSLFGGVFKLTDRVYYIINPKGDNHKPSKDVKEFDIKFAGIMMSAIEVSVDRIEEVKRYIELTRTLKSCSMPIQFANAIKLPLPLHLAAIADEYFISFYDEYFIANYLKKERDKNNNG